MYKHLLRQSLAQSRSQTQPPVCLCKQRFTGMSAHTVYKAVWEMESVAEFLANRKSSASTSPSYKFAGLSIDLTHCFLIQMFSAMNEIQGALRKTTADKQQKQS